MFDEEKESLWKKKGFYLSVCTALICVLALGTVYYKMNYQKDNGKNLFADSATAAPAPSKPDNVTGVLLLMEVQANQQRMIVKKQV